MTKSHFERKSQILRGKARFWDKNQDFETKKKQILKQKARFWDKYQDYETKYQIFENTDTRQKFRFQYKISELETKIRISRQTIEIRKNATYHRILFNTLILSKVFEIDYKNINKKCLRCKNIGRLVFRFRRAGLWNDASGALNRYKGNLGQARSTQLIFILLLKRTHKKTFTMILQTFLELSRSNFPKIGHMGENYEITDSS